jgi:hypothetical protein
VLGALLLIGSWRVYRRPRQEKGPESPSKWLDRVDRSRWLIAVAVGALMLSYTLSLAAVAEILKANVSAVESASAALPDRGPRVTQLVTLGGGRKERGREGRNGEVVRDPDRQQLEYEQVARSLGALDETRFRLLAFVPTIAGAAVGLISGRPPAVELLGIGLLGLAATVGILLYELRNSQIASELSVHAGHLERALQFDSPVLAQQLGAGTDLFGLIGLSRARGLALVYAAALAGWSYLAAWGLLHAVELANARTLGLIVGGGIGLVVFFEVERIERAVKEGSTPQ